MERILYIHGLGSSSNSNTLDIIKDVFSNKRYEIHKIEVNENPYESVKKIQHYIDNNNINIIIGCSLGGLYAAYIKNVNYKFLINPAFKIVEIIKNRIGFGLYDYFSKREDGKEKYKLDEDIINIFYSFFKDKKTYSYNSFAIYSTNDNFVGNYLQLKNIQCAYNYNFTIILKDNFEHRVNTDIIKNIKDLYEKRNVK